MPMFTETCSEIQEFLCYVRNIASSKKYFYSRNNLKNHKIPGEKHKGKKSKWTSNDLIFCFSTEARYIS